METFLRCFVHACPSKWVDWIYLAEYWYNCSWHLSLGFSPFEVLYGYTPKHFGVDANAACPVPSLAQWMQDKIVMSELVQQHLSRAQLRMKKQADQGRSERSFAMGGPSLSEAPTLCAILFGSPREPKAGFQIFRPFFHSG